MSSFVKGSLFTMGGTEYKVLAGGTSDPSSCLVYIPTHDNEGSDPLKLLLWKAEAKLARGDITLNGFPRVEMARDGDFTTLTDDPLSQLAELKQRISAIEKRRIYLYKADDLTGKILLHDNVVRPNKPFEIWTYTKSSPLPKTRCNIQFVKMRSVILTLLATDLPNEHFLFPVQDQSDCHFNNDLLIVNGKNKITFSTETRTLPGKKSEILKCLNGSQLELTIDLCFKCQYGLGNAIIYAKILNAACKRNIKSECLNLTQFAMPVFDRQKLMIAGVCVEIYTEDPHNHQNLLHN